MANVSFAPSRFVTQLASIALVLFSWTGAIASEPPGVIYALRQVNGGPNQIYGFRLNPISGALTALPGFPIATGGNGDATYYGDRLAYSNGRLFVINGGSATLSAFAVNQTTGALTPLPFSPLALGPGTWGCLAIHRTGSPVVVGRGALWPDSALASFMVTATTATPAAGSPFASGVGALTHCEFSRNGGFVYAGGLGSTFDGFSVSTSTGVLTPLPGSPFPASGSAGSTAAYATDGAGRLFLARNSNHFRVYTTFSGMPTGVADNPFSSGLTGPTYGLVHPAGFYMVSDGLGDRIGVYRIAHSGSGTTLNAVSGSPFAAGGSGPGAPALTAGGMFLVVPNKLSLNLTVFTVNASTGSLTVAGVQPAHALGATGIVAGLAFVPGPTPGDFDADAKAEIAVFRPATGQWFIKKSTANYSVTLSPVWGVSTDTLVPHDYDGDGRTDLAVYRPSIGTWYIARSSTNFSTFATHVWGNGTDVPVPGDYDGDGKSDVAIYRPSTGEWYILQSSSNYTTFIVLTWGLSTDVTVPGDYDGDTRTDVAVFRPSTGDWHVLKSSTNFATSSTYFWGGSGDIAVPGDYDGDGKTDLAFFRPSTTTWYIRHSQTNYATTSGFFWGVSTDVLVPSDYDGDGKTDFAAFSPAAGEFRVVTSGSGYVAHLSYSLGNSTDIPVLRRQ